MKITKELSELIGIIIGDGNIYYNLSKRVYYVEITGNPKKEKKYYKYISNLFRKILNKPGKIKIYQRGIRIRLYDKKFIEFLIKDLKIYHGKGKHHKIKIPKEIINSRYYSYCIRGIFDTDGSYFLSKKSHRNDYPSIEISTCSKDLANQILNKLKNKIRIRLRESKRKVYSQGIIYILSINGEKEVNKWFKLIGSSKVRKI